MVVNWDSTVLIIMHILSDIGVLFYCQYLWGYFIFRNLKSTLINSFLTSNTNKTRCGHGLLLPRPQAFHNTLIRISERLYLLHINWVGAALPHSSLFLNKDIKKLQYLFICTVLAAYSLRRCEECFHPQRVHQQQLQFFFLNRCDAHSCCNEFLYLRLLSFAFALLTLRDVCADDRCASLLWTLQVKKQSLKYIIRRNKLNAARLETSNSFRAIHDS